MKPASVGDNDEGAIPQAPHCVKCAMCQRICAVRTGPRTTICLLASGCPGSIAPAGSATADGVGENPCVPGVANGTRPTTAGTADPLQYQEAYRRECIRLGHIARRRQLQNQWLSGLRARIVSARMREVWAKRRQSKAEEEAVVLRKQVVLLKKNLRLDKAVGVLKERIGIAEQDVHTGGNPHNGDGPQDVPVDCPQVTN